MASNQMGKKTKQEANNLKCRKTNTCELLENCNKQDPYVNHSFVRWLWTPIICTVLEQWAIIKYWNYSSSAAGGEQDPHAQTKMKATSTKINVKHFQNISKIKQKYRNPPPSIIDYLATNQPCVLWIVVSLFSGKQTMVPEVWLRFLTKLFDHFHRDRSVYTQHYTES